MDLFFVWVVFFILALLASFMIMLFRRPSKGGPVFSEDIALLNRELLGFIVSNDISLASQHCQKIKRLGGKVNLGFRRLKGGCVYLTYGGYMLFEVKKADDLAEALELKVECYEPCSKDTLGYGYDQFMAR